MTDYMFSPSENAFYPLSLKDDYLQAGTWPGDGVAISADDAAGFMADAPEGMVRGVGDDNLPCWVALPPPDPAELVALANVQREQLVIEAKDMISVWQTELQLGIISDEDRESLILWLGYIKALGAVDTSTAPDIDWPVKPE